MKRITALGVAVLTFAGLALPLLATPASAHTDACAGNGTMITDGWFAELAVTPFAPRTNNFYMGLNVGTCVMNSGLWMTGTMSGWCGFSSAQGVTDTGHRFVFVNVGTAILFTGEVDGVGTLTVNALAGQSCLVVGNATNFLLNLAVDLRHCTVTKTKFQTPDPVFGVMMWSKVCV